MSFYHNLFVREHNAICDRLTEDYPNWPALNTGNAFAPWAGARA